MKQNMFNQFEIDNRIVLFIKLNSTERVFFALRMSKEGSIPKLSLSPSQKSLKEPAKDPSPTSSGPSKSDMLRKISTSPRQMLVVFALACCLLVLVLCFFFFLFLFLFFFFFSLLLFVDGEVSLAHS